MKNNQSKLIILTPMPSEHTVLSQLVYHLDKENKMNTAKENIHIIQTGMGATNILCSLLVHLPLFSNQTSVILTGFAGAIDKNIKKGEHVIISKVCDWALLDNNPSVPVHNEHGDIERIETEIPAINEDIFKNKDINYYYDKEKKCFKFTEEGVACVSFPCLLQGLNTKNIYNQHGYSVVDMESFALCSFLKTLNQEQKPKSVKIIKTITDALDNSFDIKELQEYEKLLSENTFLTDALMTL